MRKNPSFLHDNSQNSYHRLQILILSTFLYSTILQQLLTNDNIVHAFYHPTTLQRSKCSITINNNNNCYNLKNNFLQKRFERKHQLYNNNNKIEKDDSENENNDNKDKQENESDDLIDDSVVETSMEDAFRQLQNLKSIDENRKSSKTNVVVPKTSTVKIDEDIIKEIVKQKSSSAITSDTSTTTDSSSIGSTTDTANKIDLSLEKEFVSYTKMLDEIENNEQVELYRDVITELGGSTLLDTPDTYTDVILELGGTPKISTLNNNNEDDQKILITKKSIDELVDDAIQQAITESVTIQDTTTTIPVLFDSDKVVSNIIGQDNKDDEDEDIALRNEIREIIEKGNTKLLENLNSIRLEQEALTNESIQRLRASSSSSSKSQKGFGKATATTDDDDENQQIINKERMDTATATIDKMLQIISIETNNIQQATETLTNASIQLDNDPLLQLKRGGIGKQLSFIGLLLFSVRSIIDTSTAIISQVSESSIDNTDSLSFDVSQGLIEGVIAIVCAIIYSFL